jgi:alkylresorcinol/alkylpyrone synthase
MRPSAKLVSLATAVPPNVLSQPTSQQPRTSVSVGGTTSSSARTSFQELWNPPSACGAPNRLVSRPLAWPERATAYLEGACELFADAAKRALDAAELDAAQVDTIVTISSTGIATPSLEARVAGRLGFRADVERGVRQHGRAHRLRADD